MSNRIDFHPSEQRQLAIPAASFSIFVDGTLCPTLELIEIVRSGWPDFSWAKLTYNPAGYTMNNGTAVEDTDSKFGMGRPLCVRAFYSDTPLTGATLSFPIFHGYIECIETKLSGTSEWVEMTARDYSTNLKRVSVHGQRLARADGTNVLLAGLDTIFNPDGKANANPTPIETDGRIYTAFCAESSQGRLWSGAEVIDYLLSEYVPAGLLQTPSLAQLRILTDNYIVRDLDVTGLNLVEALHRCCQSIGLKFKFVPRLEPTGPREAIAFYTNATSRLVELTCQPAGQQLGLSKTNIAAMHSRKSFWPVTRRYIGQGEFEIYEATFELVKAWDGSLEDTDYDKFSPSSNPDFYKVKDVYRKWALNEAGLYCIAPYNRGAAFDFSKVFQSNDFIQRRRRFHPTLTTDTLGRSLGYFVQVSFDDGQSWWEYLHAFNVLLDECGIWLSSDQLDIDTWIAALRGFLRFRITASVVSDERLTCVVSDGPVNSTAPVIEHVITLPRQFKYRKVSDQSLFAGSTDETLGPPDEADDSDALHEFVRRTIEASPEIIATVDVQTPSLMFDYQVWDRVTTSPESRDLLACRKDNRSRSHITRVQMDFRQQCTNLKIVRWRGCR